MSYVRTNSDSVDAAQHHSSPDWSPNRRLVVQCVRLYGRDENTGQLLVADGPGGNVPDVPNTVGYEIDRALWFASGAADPSGQQRETPYWGGAFPAVAVVPSGTVSDPYKSDVVSTTFALPAFDQDPQDPGAWRGDTGVLPQKVAIPGGRQVAGGTPLIVLPFSVMWKQQMAAFEASSDLIAVWRGGAQRGPMGTLVHDVTPAGELDPVRTARDHSSWRVYRLPESGLLPFGSKTIGTAKPYPISSGLAWQQGLDVDGQAGYGAIVDLAAVAVPPPKQPEKTATGVPATVSPSVATGTAFGGVAGQLPPGQIPGSAGLGSGTVTGNSGQFQQPGSPPTTQTKPAPSPQPFQSMQVVIALTTRTAFGGHSVGQFVDKHRIAVTPDGEPVNCAHWNVRQPVDGDGFDAPFKPAGAWVKPNASGPLIVETLHVYDNDDSHQYLGGSRQGLRKWETRVPFDVPRRDDKQPGHDKSGSGDKFGGTDKAQADKLSGTDKLFSSDKYGGADKGIGDDENAKPSQDGSGLKVQGSDNLIKAGRDKGVADQATGPSDGPGPFFPPGGSQGGFQYTFGGGILVGGNEPRLRGFTPDEVAGAILESRLYARTPLEVAGPGWLARPVPLWGPDLRGRTDSLTPEQQESYEQNVPIAGAISAFCDQSSGGFRWFDGQTPGSSLYLGGSANAGGFVLTPPNVDAVRLQRDGFVPPDMPFTSFLAGTFYSLIGWADPHPSGRPMDGYVAGRGSNTTWSLDWFDSNGQTGELGVGALPPCLFADSGQDPVDPPPSFLIWGGQAVTVWNTTAGQAPAGTVFVADGTNVGPGGTWQTPSSVAASASGVFGDGSDGAYTLNGGAAGSGMTFDGALTYTMTRDIYATNLTMSGSYRLVTANWRLFVNGTLTLDASNRIGNDGNPAVNQTGGGSLGASQTVGTGQSGNNGSSLAAPGAVAGNNGTGATGSFGGSGGNSANDVFIGGAGAGGTATAPASNFGELRQTPQITLARLMSSQGDVQLLAGCGGGGGGVFYNAASAGTLKGGGGGGGAGVVMIAAKTLVNAGIIAADGGPGGAASTTGTSTGSIIAGGGGGGGGLVVLVYGSYGSTLGTVQANGGLAGTSIGSPTTPAQNGSNGRTRVLAL